MLFFFPPQNALTGTDELILVSSIPTCCTFIEEARIKSIGRVSPLLFPPIVRGDQFFLRGLGEREKREREREREREERERERERERGMEWVRRRKKRWCGSKEMGKEERKKFIQLIRGHLPDKKFSFIGKEFSPRRFS